MLAFNEGVPRSGKSYDAVLTHILPALKKGRKVFARLNGLKHDLIAAHLGLRVEDVEALLIHVPESDMPRIQQIAEPNSLVIIDECHDFYPAGFKALPKDVEKFFAEHGHYGMDILLISQWYKRLHTALRARVERKTVFQKLTAVGMKGKYLATFFHSVAPDKFEKVGKKTKTYDPAIFPLYNGYVPGTENTEVYEEGGMNVWASVTPWLIIAAVLFIGGGWAYSRYFVAKPKPAAEAPKAAAVTQGKPAVAATGVPIAGKAVAAVVKPRRPDMPAEASYVWGLSDQAKPRLAAVVDLGDGKFDGVVEWRADQSRVVDRLTVTQVRALGVAVERKPYGIKLTWGVGKDQQTMIVTSWPVDDANRYSQQQIADIRSEGPKLTSSMGGDSPTASVSDAGGGRAWTPGVGASSYQPPGAKSWNSDPWGGGKKAN
ncbi:zonular occludens toxin domain-containing protein [Dyella sp. C11]|uniref:zonular occludens toxin domain-containing protein n=1 Tax=Dyella sp. C11 TaxID=2126991 RepID=UPI000D645CD7|nr:zonular occludens toxin domain-containing protein [Dyella sp. C11]